MNSRRHFLTRSGLLATSPLVPSFLSTAIAGSAESDDGRILVVIQLDGGNDGLNSVVPYAQDEYYERRPEIALPENRLIRIDEECGLHPSLQPIAELMEQRRFTVVHGVGYPNPDRSHFRSMSIWHTGSLADELPQYGWAGRALDPHATGHTDMLFVGDEDVPMSLRGRRSIVASLSPGESLRLNGPLDPRTVLRSPIKDSVVGDDTFQSYVHRNVLEAYDTVSELTQTEADRSSNTLYPSTGLARRLQTIAGYIATEQPARIYYTIQSGYDTHENQAGKHNQLLSEFAGAINAFQRDITALGVQDRVVVMAFSEFGRRISENGSAGTDHGTAGPVFLAGEPLARPQIGEIGRLADLPGDDLDVQLDFRQIYTTLLDDWLRIPARESIDESLDKLPIFS